MSKDNQRKEPWDQPIYETEYETASSRTQKRTKKSGHSLFITALVILLLLIAGILIYLFSLSSGRSVKPKEPTIVQKESSTTPSTVASSSKPIESTVDTSAEQKQKEEEAARKLAAEQKAEAERLAEEARKAQEEANQQAQPEQPAQQTGDVVIVQAKDNLYQISLRTGVSVDELKRINGLSDNNISVGQEIRTK